MAGSCSRLFLLIALIAGLPFPALAEPPPRFTWPRPDVVEEVSIPGTVRAKGIPVKLHMLRVKRPAEEMVDFYLRAFTDAGLYVPPYEKQHPAFRDFTLVALDPRRLISYTVIFQPNRNGTTTLLLGESNLAKRSAPGQGAGPLFPGAEGVLQSVQEGAEIISYQAKARPEQIQAFYRDALGRDGFREEDPKQEPGLYSRGGEQIQLLVRAQKGGDAAVTLIRRSSAR